MLTNLILDNFKSFGSLTKVPLSRLTVIVGPNTAGKSALLQSLKLMKQNAALPIDFTGDADLGSYENVVHKHDPSNAVCVGITWDESDIRDSMEEFCPFDMVGGDVGFKCPKSIYKELGAIFEFALPGTSASMLANPPLVKSFQYLLANRTTGDTSTLDMRRHAFDRKAKWNVPAIKHHDHFRLASPAQIREFLAVARQEYRALSRNDNKRKRFRTAKVEAALRDLGWYPKTWCPYDAIPTQLRTMFGVDASDGLLEELPELNPVLIGLRGMAETVAYLCSLIDHVGPIRPEQKRQQLDSFTEYLIESALRSDQPSVESEGGVTEDIVDRLGEKMNEMLSRLGVEYQLQLSVIYDRAIGTKYHCECIDQRTKTAVNPIDTGSGLTQILPLVGLLAIGENRVFLVEQPELHLHPRLQAALAQEMALPEPWFEGPAHRQWIVETHSELFILRLQKLIRQEKLSPHDVSVIYVDQQEGHGSYARRLEIDTNGEFVDEWPGGFFEEGYREMFGDES